MKNLTRLLTVLRKVIQNFCVDLFSKAQAHFRTFFQYDISRTALFEVLFAAVIVFLLLAEQTGLSGTDVTIQIVCFFFLWAYLALQGFFIPVARQSWVVGIGGNMEGPGARHPGIPLQLSFSAKGGFIAGRKIKLKMKVLNLGSGEDTREKFKREYDEANFAFFSSIQLPIRHGTYLEGAPEAGGVKVDSQKLQGYSTIVFQNPGKYKPMLLFNFKNNPRQQGGPLPETVLSNELTVSPSENWIALRNYSITYALTLIIIMLSLLQIGFL